MTRILPAGPAELGEVRALFEDYAAWLRADQGHDLHAEGFAEELAGLPGAYAPPEGALLLARDGAGTATGCVALRGLGGGVVEVKRLFVLPGARGQALGRRLAEAALAEARALGHRRVVLDSLAGLTAARRLYAGLGFAPIAPYHDGPSPPLVFMGRDL